MTAPNQAASGVQAWEIRSPAFQEFIKADGFVIAEFYGDDRATNAWKAVHAVNTLPAMEAALRGCVEVLAEFGRSIDCDLDHAVAGPALEAARAVLR